MVGSSKLFHHGFISTSIFRVQNIHLRARGQGIQTLLFYTCSERVDLDDWTRLYWMRLRVHSHLKTVGFVLEKEQKCRSSSVSCNTVNSIDCLTDGGCYQVMTHQYCTWEVRRKFWVQSLFLRLAVYTGNIKSVSGHRLQCLQSPILLGTIITVLARADLHS